ncbi:thioesterase-like superfamily-domain-containing protein [Pestalotiopsis sp. NC0098]|nr:thioesterase-like superfamily-domain-containing protein [Pestalotiopsis sp. NC0098]
MAPETVPDIGERLTFQEQMKLVELPDVVREGAVVKRFMSQRAPWVPGCDLPIPNDSARGKMQLYKSRAAFGGHVYSQAGLVASKTFASVRGNVSSVAGSNHFGIHTIHGYFSEGGLSDRPFVYEVSTVAENRSFHNLLVKARQSTSPSSNPEGDHFPLADSEHTLGPVCFSALVSFRPATESQVKVQAPSAQMRYADILSLRPPWSWDPAPLVDIAGIIEILETRKEVGTFPIVEMRKVDMTGFNEGKPLHERRELLLYRLLAPLPSSDPDAHVMVHAYAADRNGLLMIGNHIGFGFSFGRAASLSYSFVVHVNPSDAVMEFGENEWWIQEAIFPRVEAGRGVITSNIWSPNGTHVATEYQDGIIQRQFRPGEKQGKL